MTNAEETKLLLGSVDSKTRSEILSNIAANYGITEQAAFEGVTHEDAHDLLDYITGSLRAKVSLLDY